MMKVENLEVDSSGDCTRVQITLRNDGYMSLSPPVHLLPIDSREALFEWLKPTEQEVARYAREDR